MVNKNLAAQKKDIHKCILILKSIGQLCALVRLYNARHPIVKNKIQQTFLELNRILSEEKSVIFSGSEGVFFANGEKIEGGDSLVERFIENFNMLRIGSIELTAGLTPEEFETFIRLISRIEKLEGEEKIKQYLKEKNTRHIVVLFATYKLVKENEQIIKEGESIKIDKMPPDIIEKFVRDLKNGEVSARMRTEKKIYTLLAHNPEGLCKIVAGIESEEEKHEDIEKTLWLIADYLIDEISSGKAEKINQQVLSNLKERLFSLWEQRQDKDNLKERAEKAFTQIGAAMQLEGYILLYEKHKKELESIAGKIKNILESLSGQSRLYQLSKERLQKIGMIMNS
ncbi:MAG: hypothetical protein V1662_01310 [Candidatus Omnitrophota bacterium]